MDAILDSEPSEPDLGDWSETARRPEDDMPLGLPRPLKDGMPVPYITAGTPANPGWQTLDPHRSHFAYEALACQVCGLEVEGECAVVIDEDNLVVDEAPLHLRCGRMAMSHCPHLKDKPGYSLWLGPVADVRESLDELGSRRLPKSFQPAGQLRLEL